jgi:NTP pyrophosphatase (non-canonical NTP hydrolase)
VNLLKFQTMAGILAGVAWPTQNQDLGRLDAELGDKLAEEVGELAKVCRRHGIGGRQDWQGALTSTATTDEVMDEAGDVLFVLARRALLHGVNLEMAGERSLAKFLMRLQAMGFTDKDLLAFDRVAQSQENDPDERPLSAERLAQIASYRELLDRAGTPETQIPPHVYKRDVDDLSGYVAWLEAKVDELYLAKIRLAQELAAAEGDEGATS